MRTYGIWRRLLLLGFAGSLAASAISPSPASGIGNGEEPDPTPVWAARLTNVDTVFLLIPLQGVCSGSLIDLDLILTAAHCVTDASVESSWIISSGDKRLRVGNNDTSPTVVGYVVDDEDLEVVIGRGDLASGEGYERAVESVQIHPRYTYLVHLGERVGCDIWDWGQPDCRLINRTEVYYDVALLKLSEPLPAVLLPLSLGAAEPGQDATVYGYGRTSRDGPLSDSLQRTPAGTATLDAECFPTFSVPQQCLSTSDGVTINPGDSGGPWVQDIGGSLVQIGLSSTSDFVDDAWGPDLGEMLDWISEESGLGVGDPPTGDGVAVALVIDSSGSMGSNDPTNQRTEAGGAYLTASTVSDAVGVVDFDSSASILSYAVNPVTQKEELLAALNLIDSSGGTNLGAGLTAGCEVLENATDHETKAALFFTDGQGSYAGEEQCYADAGWKVFTFGLGSGVDQALLQSIADATGGSFRQLDDTTNLVCEFQQVRAQIAGAEPATCEPLGIILPDEVLSFPTAVAAGLTQITFTSTWPGSDIEMTLIAPSGRHIDRSTEAADVVVDVGSTHESITITEPESGDWTVELLGADVAETGEEFTLSTVAIEGSNEPPTASFDVVVVDRDTVAVDATPSQDPDGDIAWYQWDFGDGAGAIGATAEHNYLNAGTYTISLTVVDDDDESASATAQVDILGFLSAQQVRRDLIDSLSVLLNGSPADASIERAIDWLAASLEPRLWSDEDSLDASYGHAVFSLDQRVVDEIGVLAAHREIDASLGSTVNSTLFDLDHALAQAAIDEAIASGVDPRRLTRAVTDLEKAVLAAAHGQWKRAIGYTWKAWARAVGT